MIDRSAPCATLALPLPVAVRKRRAWAAPGKRSLASRLLQLFFDISLSSSNDTSVAASRSDPSESRATAAASHEPLNGRERRAFERLVLPHLDAAYTYARYLTRNAASAEDITHDAFVRALRGFRRFRGGDAKAWLLTIVRNCVYTQSASNRRNPPSYDPTGAADDIVSKMAVSFEDPAMSPEANTEAQREIDRLQRAIASLEAPFREVLVLCDIEEMSYREIALVLDIPIGTVMSRLARARTRLAKALDVAEGATHA